MVLTKGDVIVDQIKVGDVHYEFEYGMYIKSTVKTLPARDTEGLWSWKSETDYGKIIHYSVDENYPHYAPKLYTSMVYSGCKELK